MNAIIKLKQIINRLYGKIAQHNYIYVDTDSLLVSDCDYCRNAYTCDELSHDNDLSYMGCGTTDRLIRMMFRSGDKRPTQLIVEQLCITGINHQRLEWQLIAALTPNYCPFCGRPLFENMKQKENKNV